MRRSPTERFLSSAYRVRLKKPGRFSSDSGSGPSAALDLALPLGQVVKSCRPSQPLVEQSIETRPCRFANAIARPSESEEIGMQIHRVAVPLFGLEVTPMTAREAAQWASSQSGKELLLNHNLHSAYLFQISQSFRELYQDASCVVIDGAPIVALSRLAERSVNAKQRIGSTDWIELLHASPHPGRLCVFGAKPESNARAVERLRKQLGPSGWQVDGLDGYVSQAEAVAWLRRKEPTLVLIGLGMPLQEQFLIDHWAELPAAVYATVGGAIDYVGGSVALAPRWMGRVGIEWVWRLLHDPRRLAHRYLVEPLLLGWVLVTRRRSRTSRLVESDA